MRSLLVRSAMSCVLLTLCLSAYAQDAAVQTQAEAAVEATAEVPTDGEAAASANAAPAPAAPSRPPSPTAVRRMPDREARP